MAVLEQDVLVGRLQCVVLGLQRGLLQEEVLVRGQERGVLGLELVEPRLHRARHLPLPWSVLCLVSNSCARSAWS